MYADEFKSNEDVASEFSVGKPHYTRQVTGEDNGYTEILTLLNDSYVYLAWYDCGGWSGEAWVIYKHKGKLYEVNASHCSCFGLEDQWGPQETSWEAIKIRKLYYQCGDKDVRQYVEKLCNAQIEVK